MPEARRHAIVTGAAGGLGRAIAVRLARDAWHLALADLDAAGSQETLRAVQAAGGAGQVEPLDVTDPDGWRAMVGRLQADWPALDLLVNNAGVAGAGRVGEFPLADWRWIIDTNLFGVVQGCHACLDWLKRNPRGAHILNVASLAGLASFPCSAAYNASKAAIISLSETLYSELAATKVGTTVVCPGFFPTGLMSRGRMTHEALRRAGQQRMLLSGYSAADVAEQAVRAVGSRRLYLVLGWRARCIWRLKRWLPCGFGILLRCWGRKPIL